MHEYEVSIEQACIENGQEQEYEQLEEDADVAITVSSIIVVVHLVHVTITVANDQVHDEDQQRVEQSAYAKPGETLTQDAGKAGATMSLDLYPAHEHENQEKEGVEQCSCQDHGDVLGHSP